MLRKTILSVALSSAAVLLSTTGATTAQAQTPAPVVPMLAGCTTRKVFDFFNGYGQAKCTLGTHTRAKAVCTNGDTVWGQWVRTGQWSSATCWFMGVSSVSAMYKSSASW